MTLSVSLSTPGYDLTKKSPPKDQLFLACLSASASVLPTPYYMTSFVRAYHASRHSPEMSFSSTAIDCKGEVILQVATKWLACAAQLLDALKQVKRVGEGAVGMI